MLLQQVPLPIVFPSKTPSPPSSRILAPGDSAMKILRLGMLIFDMASHVFAGFETTATVRAVLWMVV